MKNSSNSRRDRLRRLPLVTLLIFFISLLIVGKLYNPMFLAIWVAVWGTVGIIWLALKFRHKL